jgi:hypothetical protein
MKKKIWDIGGGVSIVRNRGEYARLVVDSAAVLVFRKEIAIRLISALSDLVEDFQAYEGITYLSDDGNLYIQNKALIFQDDNGIDYLFDKYSLSVLYRCARIQLEKNSSQIPEVTLKSSMILTLLATPRESGADDIPVEFEFSNAGIRVDGAWVDTMHFAEELEGKIGGFESTTLA